MSAAWLIRRRFHDGLQPINLGRDLAELADLIELCFADSGDPDLRGVVGEMRAMSRIGPLLELLGGPGSMGLAVGYVWRENGHVVGNVSVFRADAPPEAGVGWVIANVAVHPDYRRRGIARQLMGAAMDYVAHRGGWAALQVRRDNEAALGLYRSLGFRENGAWLFWYRPSGLRVPRETLGAGGRFRILPLRRGDWRAEYELARIARPNGMGWLRPVSARYFRRSIWSELWGLMCLRMERRWAIWEGGRLIGAVTLRRRLDMRSDEVVLLVHPDHRGGPEAELIRFVTERYVGAGRVLVAEHPAEDEAAEAAFRAAGFRLRRELVYMRWDA